jgi:hypothetical protein
MTEDQKAAVKEFARSILHGDAEHRRWLMDAAEAFCEDKSMPKVRNAKGVMHR